MLVLFLLFLVMLICWKYDSFAEWHQKEFNITLPNKIGLPFKVVVIIACIFTCTLYAFDLTLLKPLSFKPPQDTSYKVASSYPDVLKIIKPTTKSLLIDKPALKRVDTKALIIHGTAGTGLDQITTYHNSKWQHQGYHIIILKDGTISCPVDPNSLTMSYGIKPGIGKLYNDTLTVSLNNAHVLNLAFETPYAESEVPLTEAQIYSFKKSVLPQILRRYRWIALGFHGDFNNTACPNLSQLDIDLLKEIFRLQSDGKKS